MCFMTVSLNIMNSPCRWNGIKTVLFLLTVLPDSLSALGPGDKFNHHYLPNMRDEIHSKLGDINIGATRSIYYSYPGQKCQHKVYTSSYVSEATESIAFAVDQINKDPSVLPNVTLGFINRGVCSLTGVHLAAMLSFLPRNELVCNGTVCNTQHMMSSESKGLNHDVIGILPSGLSSFSIPVSALFSVAHVPMIGLNTYDDFSDKFYHPYYFRLIPREEVVIKVTLQFIAANGWSYISIIYRGGDDARKAYEHVYKNVHKYGICIASSHRLINSSMNTQIAKDLMEQPRARVVVVILGKWPFKLLLDVVHDMGGTGKFIWLSTANLHSYPGWPYKGIELAQGVFTLSQDISYAVPYYEYIRRINISTTINPWIKPVWEFAMDCSYDEGTCDPEVKVLPSRKYEIYIATSLEIDAVNTFARAAHNLLKDRCPRALGAEARKCITGDLLRQYLKKVDFESYSGRIKFDKNQDREANLAVFQLIKDYYQYPYLSGNTTSTSKVLHPRRVANYNTKTDSITFVNEMSWSHLNVLDRIVPWTNDSLSIEIPESVCSRPCVAGEYKIEKELVCCWECRRCRDNERIVNDSTSCEACPLFTWPDPETEYMTCIDIPLTYPLIYEAIPIVFVSIAIVCLIATLSVLITYVYYRKERVIKASSRELSLVQLGAILLGYTTVILFQTMPTKEMCGAIFFTFCLSFALLYCPLLVKTVRIYRIFTSGVKNEKPRYISPTSQLIFTDGLIAIQIVMCSMIYILFSPGALRTQPIWSEKMVELSCDLTLPGLASFLGYNVLLVILCSLFAFTTRKLPDNFNESKFITMCVSTTLLIWLAFIPTYFTSDRAYIRGFLLSMALILNHTVALVFLFIPKIYAVKCLSPEAATFSSGRS